MNNYQNNINILIELGNKTYINIFKKNKLRNFFKIINDCEKMKKKKLINLSNELRNLSNNIIDVDMLKISYEKILYDIDNLNKIVNLIKKEILFDDIFIEIYGN